MSRVAWTWRHAILASPLPAMTKFVLLVISCFMNDLGEGCYRATRDLARFCSLSERSVCTHIEYAVRAGWLKKSQHGFRGQRWKRHEYEPMWPGEGAERGSAASDEALNVPRERTEPDGAKALNEVQQDKNISESISPSSPVARARGEAEFGKFWEAWPEATRPEKRSLAAKRFADLSPDEQRMAAQFAEAYRATRRSAGEFAGMLPYLSGRLFVEFADAPEIDGDRFVITPDRPEWAPWIDHFRAHHRADIVEGQAAKGFFRTPTRWPPNAAETAASVPPDTASDVSPSDAPSPHNGRTSNGASQ